MNSAEAVEHGIGNLTQVGNQISKLPRVAAGTLEIATLIKLFILCKSMLLAILIILVLGNNRIIKDRLLRLIITNALAPHK